MPAVFFTIAARNYLAQALTLFDSLAVAHPDSQLYLCLIDNAVDDPALATDAFSTITIDQLDLPHFDAFVFRYDLLELSTAVKPSMFRWLRKQHPDAALIYLDPDILVLERLHVVEQAFHNGAALVLTPHLLEPVSDHFLPGEQAMLRSGAYNGGFVGIGAGASADRIIDWWAARLEYEGFVDLPAGLFTDQKWLDLMPSLFADVCILRDPGYNVAYWNLAQRPVSTVGNRHHAAGRPLAFVHFSGVDPQQPALFSRHQNRFDADDLGALRPIYDDYLHRLAANGQGEHRHRMYPWQCFADGEPISRAHREVYRQHFDLRSATPVASPRTMDRSAFDAPSDRLPVNPSLPVSRLMMAVWTQRDDLRAAFDVGEREGRAAFVRWFLRNAGSECAIAERHVAPIRMAYANHIDDASARIRRSHQWAALSRRIGSSSLALIDRTTRLSVFRWLYRGIPVALKRRVHASLERMNYARDPAMAMASDKRPSTGINLVGYAHGEFGVGEMLRTTAAALEHGGVPFVICDFPMGPGLARKDMRVDHHLSTVRPHHVNLHVINADQMSVAHEHFGRAAFADHYNVANWAWELERFPKRWDSAFDLVDEFWVISDFVRCSIAARTDKPVVVVPPPIMIDTRRLPSREQLGMAADAFVFLVSFDFNSQIQRKNPQAAIAAFRQAFAHRRRDVRLLIKTSNGDRHPDALDALCAAAAGDSRIEVRDGTLDRASMWGLQAGCDAYVSLHRSEGFGLGMAECMALGKPVVATAYSGNLDFMHAGNSRLVDFEMIALRDGDYPGWCDQHWADPSIEHASMQLRELADDPAAARLLGARARTSINTTHSREAMLAVVRTRLAQIHSRFAPPRQTTNDSTTATSD